MLAGRQSSSIFVSVMAWNLYGNIFKTYVDKTYKLMYHQTGVKPTNTEQYDRKNVLVLQQKLKVCFRVYTMFYC